VTAPYIVFEGFDGCGKTTIAKALFAALREQSESVAHLHQPGTVSRAGQLILEVFAGRARFSPEAMLWLFAAELADLEPQIREMREDGVMVIGDRHTMYSAMIYQVPIHGRVVVERTLRAIAPAIPTLTYIIDVPGEVALRRQAERAKAHNTLYEPRDVKRVNELCAQYRNIPEWLEPPSFWPRNIKILDGLRPIQENVQSVLYDLDQRQ
jgi:dTMP kinase